MGERDIPAEVGASAEQTNLAASEVVAQERLEALLFDDSSSAQSVDQVLTPSSRIVGNGIIRHPAPLIILLLLTAVLFAAGYYILTNLATAPGPVAQTDQYVSPKIPLPPRPQIDSAIADKLPKTQPVVMEKNSPVTDSFTDNVVPLYTVAVGPFVNAIDLQQAISLLKDLGFQPQKLPGRGPVTMIRLLEGIYPEEDARIRTAELRKTVKSTFLLPLGDKFAVYTGSFHQEDRARSMQDDLALQNVEVSLVDSEVTMDGTLLVALQADQKTADEVAAHISSLGLHTQLLEKK